MAIDKIKYHVDWFMIGNVMMMQPVCEYAVLWSKSPYVSGRYAEIPNVETTHSPSAYASKLLMVTDSIHLPIYQLPWFMIL